MSINTSNVSPAPHPDKHHIGRVLERWATMRGLSVEWISVSNAAHFPLKRVPYSKRPPAIMIYVREGNNEGHIVELFANGTQVLMVKTLGEDMTGAWQLGAAFAALVTQRTQGTSYAWRVEHSKGAT